MKFFKVRKARKELKEVLHYAKHVRHMHEDIADPKLMEALRAGTTTIFDHHASPRFIDGSLDVVAGSLRQVGLRGALCYGASDRAGEPDGLRGVRESARFAAHARSERMLRGLVGLHASMTISDKTLERCVALAKEFETGLHIHVAEDLADQQREIKAREDAKPAELAISTAPAKAPAEVQASTAPAQAQAQAPELPKTPQMFPTPAGTP